MRLKRYRSAGFTLVELIVVIVVIGILAAVTVVAYNGVQRNARDVSVLSDIDTMDSSQTSYALKSGGSGKAYYSGANATDGELGFAVSNDNIIDVVVGSAGYCIRGYNLKANKNSIQNSFTKESVKGACALLPPSAQAVADSEQLNNPLNYSWASISAGNQHTCAINTVGKLYCWGGNGSTLGLLGNGSTANSSTPVAVDTSGVLNGKTIKSVAVSTTMSCAIASDDRAYCWGANASGQLGNNSTVDSPVPVAVTMSGVLSGRTIKAIDVGRSQACALASDSQVYCWGANASGQLGNNSTTNSSVPVAVSTSGVLSGRTVKDLSMIADHSCVIASDNQTYCWGDNGWGQLGNNTTTASSIPVAVDRTGVLSGRTIKAVSAANQHTCAIASDNQAYCWGINASLSPALGNNTIVQSSVPVAVYTAGALSGKTVTQISAGINYTCAIASDNQIYCWGAGDYGQLGTNAKAASRVPIATIMTPFASETPVSLSAGWYSACALTASNKAYCWGSNTSGRLGDGTTTESLIPKRTVTP